MGEELLQRVGDRADGKRRLIDSDKTEGACMLVACLSEEYSDFKLVDPVSTPQGVT